MPRDASGTYTLPIAPFQPLTLAKSAEMNAALTDIADALTDSQSRASPTPAQGDLNMNGHNILNLGEVVGTLTASAGVWANAQPGSFGLNYNGTNYVFYWGSPNYYDWWSTSNGTRYWHADTSGDVMTLDTSGNLHANGTISAGGAISTPSNISASGNASVGGTVTANVVNANGISSSGNLTAGYITSTGNVNAAGTFTGGALNIGGGTITAGSVNASGLTVSGAASLGGTLTSSAVFAPSGLFVGGSGNTGFGMFVAGSDRALRWDVAGWGIFWEAANGYTDFRDNNGANLVRITADGNFIVNYAQAFKPGGGSWVDTSDDRVKRNVAPYQSGLAEILQLRPISYEFNGEGGTADTGRTYVGLSAQATRDVMPEMVFDLPAETEPQPGLTSRLPGQLALDPSALTYALVNAVQALSAQVAALEAKVAAGPRNALGPD